MFEKFNQMNQILDCKKSIKTMENILVFVLLNGGITLGRTRCRGFCGLRALVVGLEEDVLGAELDGEGPGDLGSRSSLAPTLLRKNREPLRFKSIF